MHHRHELGDTPAAYIDFKAAKTFDALLARPFEYASWDDAYGALGRQDRAAFDRVRHRTLAEFPGGVRLQIDRAALVRTIDASVAASTEYWPRLGGISCPVSVLVGAGGDWSPLTENEVQRYRDSLSAASVEYLPGGHDLGMRTNRAPLYAALGRLARAAGAI